MENEEKQYRKAMGLDSVDLTRPLMIRAIKADWKRKGYKVSEVYKLKGNQLFVIYNKLT